MDIKKKENESELSYIARMYRSKVELQMNNKEINKLINSELRTNYAESTTRCKASSYNEGYEDAMEIMSNKSENDKNEYSLDSLKYSREDGYEQIKNYKQTVEINKDGSYTLDRLIGIEDESKLKDENYLLKCHGYDPKLWQIVSARNSKWNVQLKGGAIDKLYASRINIKPRVDNINLDELKEEFDKFSKKYTKVHKNKIVTNGDNMLVLPFNDLHFGKQSFVFETGYELDDKIIEKRFFNVLEDIVNQVRHLKFDKVIFPIGSDFFNSDTMDNTTTKGTRQDNSLRWQEMFVKGLNLLIKGIDYIVNELECPVETMYIMGNHDSMCSFFANMYLSAWYKDDENVNVDINGMARKYILYGKCLIGLTHGDKEGKRIYGLMQKEVPELWGKSKYREFITGHVHHETVDEKDGLKVRTTPAICGIDFWHYASGYVGNLEQLQGFVYNKEKGLRTIVYGSYE